MCSAMQHARSASEARLFALGLSDLHELVAVAGSRKHNHAAPPHAPVAPHALLDSSDLQDDAYRGLDVDDEDFEFPMLSSSVVEEEEDEFARTAMKALQHLRGSPACAGSSSDPASARIPATAQSASSAFTPTSCSPVPDCEGEDDIYSQVPRNALYADSDNGYWSPASLGSSSGTSSSSSSGSSFSSVSPMSSCDTEDYIDDYLSFKPHHKTATRSSSMTNNNHLGSQSLASRRGRPMTIALPPRPTSFSAAGSTPLASESAAVAEDATTPAAPFKALYCAPSNGVLRDNFAGVSLRRTIEDVSDIEAPLRLRTRRTNYGFAF